VSGGTRDVAGRWSTRARGSPGASASAAPRQQVPADRRSAWSAAAATGNPLAEMPGGESGTRYGLEVYAQAFNVLNHLNAQAFSGVLASPFFGQPVSAAAPRRIEIGARLTF